MSSEDSNYSSQGERVRSNTVTLSPLSCNDLFWSKQYVLAFFIKIRFSPAQEVKEEEIQTVLQNYLLPDSKDALKSALVSFKCKVVFYNSPLILSQTKKEYLQQIHDDLAGALQKCGIEELNLHVVQQKRPTREFGSRLFI